MKKSFIFLFIIFLSTHACMAQNQIPTFKSNPQLNFIKYLTGVKYASIELNIANQEQVDKREGIAAFYFLAQRYLKDLGFEYVALTSAEKTELELSVKSYCEFTSVMFGGDIDKKSIANMSLTFVTCNGDVFIFQSDKTFNYGKFTDVEKKLVADWKSIVGTRGPYRMEHQLKLPTNPSDYNISSIKKYLTANASNLKPVEGIYERVRLSFEDLAGGRYTVGVIKNPEADEFLIVYLSGARNNRDWKEGELKGKLYKTSTPGFYTVDWITRDKSLFEDVYGNIDDTGLSIYSSGVFPLAYKFIKTLPLSD